MHRASIPPFQSPRNNHASEAANNCDGEVYNRRIKASMVFRQDHGVPEYRLRTGLEGNCEDELSSERRCEHVPRKLCDSAQQLKYIQGRCQVMVSGPVPTTATAKARPGIASQ